MPGFRLPAAVEVAGELQLLVETGAEVRAARLWHLGWFKGRREVRVRDLPAGGRVVTVVWRTRISRCADPDRGGGSYSERSEAIAHQAVSEFVEVFCDRQQLHSSRGYLCPAEYERQVHNARRLALHSRAVRKNRSTPPTP